MVVIRCSGVVNMTNECIVPLTPRGADPQVLSLVVPVYNEADNISTFVMEVDRVLSQQVDSRIELVFVNDGSTDGTLAALLKLQRKDCRVRVVDLTRNFGKEHALSAGLAVAVGGVVVPIDVDLQDPPGLILNMLERWRDGYDVVLARRANRDAR